MIQTFSDFLEAIASHDGVISSGNVLAILADHGVPASDFYGINDPAATTTGALRDFLGY
jgi:hypothetical protein